MTKITTLANGLRVVTVDIPTSHTATTAVFVKVGSRYETKEINGLSHALEHLLFKSSMNRSTFQKAYEIERIGAHFNAWTSKEQTVYYVQSLPEHTETSVDILSDMIINPAFIREELDTERGVILQEIAREQDDPNSLCWNFFDTAAYPEQSYGRTILGDPEFINTMTDEHLCDYMKKYYTTGNTIIVCAGKVNHDNFVELIKKYFANYNIGEMAKPEPAAYVGGYNTFNKNFEQSNIMYGFSTCNILDPNYIVYDILGALFGGGMSSPLFTEIREKRGLVYSVNSYSFQWSDTGMFYVNAGTTPDNLDEFFKVSFEELKKLLTDISDEDIYRAKNQLKANKMMQLEQPFSIANEVVNELFLYGEEKSIDEYLERIDIDEYLERIDNVTVEQLKDAVKTMLSNPISLSIVGPEPDKNYYEILKSMQ